MYVGTPGQDWNVPMTHERKNKTFAQLDRDNDVNNVNDEENEDQLDFEELHPGHQFSYLKKLKYHVVPKISMTANKLCNIELLRLWEEHPNTEVL